MADRLVAGDGDRAREGAGGGLNDELHESCLVGDGASKNALARSTTRWRWRGPIAMIVRIHVPRVASLAPVSDDGRPSATIVGSRDIEASAPWTMPVIRLIAFFAAFSPG